MSNHRPQACCALIACAFAAFAATHAYADTAASGVALDDPLLANAWHLNNTGQSGGTPGVDLGAFEAWAIAQGDGQMIAIVDTGVDHDHPDLDIAPGYDFADDDNEPTPDIIDDDHPHGTSMAGVAAGRGGDGYGVAGVAPRAQVLPVKITGGNITHDGIGDALIYAVQRGAGVLSNSWGYGGATCDPVELTDALKAAIDYAETEGRDGLGAVVVFSAGNGGCEVTDNAILADERLVVVGAYDHNGARADYSNTGAMLDVMGPSGVDLDGDAGLWTTDMLGVRGYDNQDDHWGGASGTSAATAAVSGVFALMFSANPTLTAAQARAIVCDTAIRDADDADWDASGRSTTHGCGRIDAAAAVAAAAALAPAAEDDAPSKDAEFDDTNDTPLDNDATTPPSADDTTTTASSGGCQTLPSSGSGSPWGLLVVALAMMALRWCLRPR